MTIEGGYVRGDEDKQTSGLAQSGAPSTSATPRPHVYVVDDDDSFRVAIGRTLRVWNFEVTLYRSADELLDEPLRNDRGCILLDVQMAGLNGLELQGRLAHLGNALPIIFLTGHGDIPTSVRAIKAGADDFLSKPVSTENLREAIGRALERYDATQARYQQLDAMRALIAALTPREREVFDLVVRGKLNKQIAFSLGTSERTIKAHRRSIMQKLQVRSVAEAVSIAERLGMLSSTVGPGRDPIDG